MGTTNSKSDTDTVHNEIIVHQTELTNSDLIMLMYVICIFVVIKFVLSAYKTWHRTLKKRYMAKVHTIDQI